MQGMKFAGLIEITYKAWEGVMGSVSRRQKHCNPLWYAYADAEQMQSIYNPSPSPQAGLLHLRIFSPVLSCYQTHSGIAICPFRHTSFTHPVISSLQIYRAFSQNSVTKMPPIEKPVPGAKYDIVFIGGGSGGSAGSVCFKPSLLIHVAELTTSCVASRLALWRKDSPYRGIREARRYLRKRW
jgi:hypothetical protein